MAFVRDELLTPNLNLSIYGAKVSLYEGSGSESVSKKWGYSKKDHIIDSWPDTAMVVRAAQREKLRRELGGGCLNVFETQLLTEKLGGIPSNCSMESRKDVFIDTSNKQNWFENNPPCVGREPWEWLKWLPCGPLQLQVDANKTVCDIQVPVYSEKEQCDVNVSLDICKEVCDIDFDIVATTKDCSTALDLLRTQCDTCDISAEVLIECADKCEIVDLLVSAAKCKIN